MSTTPEPDAAHGAIPRRVLAAIARLRPSERERVYVVVADWPDVRAVARVAIGLRATLGQASSAMVRGRLTSQELVEGMVRIRRLTAALEAARDELARRAGVYDPRPPMSPELSMEAPDWSGSLLDLMGEDEAA